MKYLKNIVVLMAGCMSLVSCEDKLTEKPNSYYTEDEFFSDPDNVEMGILGIYNVLPSLYGDDYLQQVCGECVDIHLSGT